MPSYPAFQVLCPNEIRIFSKDILEPLCHIRHQKILKFLFTRARRIIVAEAAENNMDDAMKDLLPTKFFHCLLRFFFLSIPISECIQPKPLKFKSKIDFLDN